MKTSELLTSLRNDFESESVKFDFWKNSEMEAVLIENKFCKGAVSPFGAHVLSYIPRGKEEVIFIAEEAAFVPPKSIRGGVPVCWPWFGPAADPLHGVARIQYWKMVCAKKEADGSDTITFSLQIEKPQALEAVFSINFGAKLSMKLTTRNNGTADYNLTDALHTYFKVGEIEKTVISGLGGSTFDNRVTKTVMKCSGDFSFMAETDNIYASDAAVTIIDPVMNRKILVEKSSSKATVVWNPWIEKSKNMSNFGDEEYHHMVCVEAANAGADIVILAPGKTHVLSQIISLL